MNRNSFDLLAVAAIAAAATALTLAGGATRALPAAALALVLPGYALTAAAFPKRSLGPAERLLCALGLSLALAALGGLALHWTRWGLRPAPWALLLGGITLTACAVAQHRRRQQAAPLDEPRRASPPTHPLPLLRQSLLLSLAAALALGALALNHGSALERRDAGFTQLWLLPAAEEHGVRLGVTNLEQGPLRYRLQLQAAGRPLQTWETITLDPGAQWQATATPPAGQPLEAILYRLDAPEKPYRHVMLRR
jgi:uncharacterized membrane protein